jgi:hypothetical protein
MPAFEAYAEEDGSVVVNGGYGSVRLTDRLNKPDQIMARLILSLWARAPK